MYKLSYDSPLGILTLIEEEEALTALTMSGQRWEEKYLPADAEERSTPLLRKASRWLDAYFGEGRPGPVPFPLCPKGTAFQIRVWTALRGIPYGETVTYGELAQTLSSGPRAVGNAVGRNPISILIPCHRVIGADGSLTGYAGGTARKGWLLQWEAQH